MDGNGDCSSHARRARRRAFQRQLGLGIRKLRRERGWKLEDLAERLGVTRFNLAKWESGAHAPPLYELARLLEVLDVTFDELVHGHRPPVLPPGLRNELAIRLNGLNRAMRSLLQSPEKEKRKEPEE